MNEITVRTHQGEYYAGDIIYGMIYLKVETTDFAETVKLMVHGIEQCEYSPAVGDDWAINHSMDTLRSPYVDKLMSNSIDIFVPKEPLPVGTYKFPFQYKLKPDLPSTTAISSLGKGECVSKWQGSVMYSVTASTSTGLSDSQPFVCFGKKRTDIFPMGYHSETTIKKCFCYDSGKISLLVNSDKPFYTTGETVRLFVNVENKSSECTKSVHCWLKRTVKMKGCWVANEMNGNDTTVAEVYSRYRYVRQDNEVSVDAQDINHAILDCVDAKDTRNWLHTIHLSSVEDGSLLPPSTCGKYLRIKYSLVVQVKVPRATDLIVSIPLSCVLPFKNTEWLEWKTESWMRNCTMLPGQDKLAVRQSVLESPLFEGLP